MITKNCDESLFEIDSVKPSDWKKMPAVFSEGKLKIADHPVMEDWEESYMKELAMIASSNGGVVLELGFGLGLSASHIQKHNIDKHIIIEANEDVFKKLECFSETSKNKVEPVFGLWEEVLPSIPSESIDGILYDTYITSFDNEEQFTFEYFPFFEHAYRVLKKGGVFTYYSSEVFDFSPKHLELLKNTGFENIEKRVCQLNRPSDCLYWTKDTMIAPIVRK